MSQTNCTHAGAPGTGPSDLGAPSGGQVSLEASRRYCQELTRREARNFYFGLKLLPEPKRTAMYAIYAYMRLVDDIADDDDQRTVAQRSADLEVWREQTHAALDGREAPSHHPLWPAFADVARRHAFPARIFDDIIAGQHQDLEPRPFETFEELHGYCYRVAGVVGLASIYVWGFEGGQATEALAIERGVAFQLTNILRDLREDAARGRIYLPRSEMASLGVSPEDLGSGANADRLIDLMRFQIHRAEEYYIRSSPLESCIERDSRPTLIAMTQIYHRLLEKIAQNPRRALDHRVSLSVWAKLRIGWRALRA